MSTSRALFRGYSLRSCCLATSIVALCVITTSPPRERLTWWELAESRGRDSSKVLTQELCPIIVGFAPCTIPGHACFTCNQTSGTTLKSGMFGGYKKEGLPYTGWCGASYSNTCTAGLNCSWLTGTLVGDCDIPMILPQ